MNRPALRRKSITELEPGDQVWSLRLDAVYGVILDNTAGTPYVTLQRPTGEVENKRCTGLYVIA